MSRALRQWTLTHYGKYDDMRSDVFQETTAQGLTRPLFTFLLSSLFCLINTMKNIYPSSLHPLRLIDETKPRLRRASRKTAMVNLMTRG